jgi:hypothetical protein
MNDKNKSPSATKIVLDFLGAVRYFETSFNFTVQQHFLGGKFFFA